jgi:hypothetical protein
VQAAEGYHAPSRLARRGGRRVLERGRRALLFVDGGYTAM